MPANRGLHGWLVIDKPQGLTSNRVVEQRPPQHRSKGGTCRNPRSAGDRRAADSARRSDQNRHPMRCMAANAIASASAGVSPVQPTIARARSSDESECAAGQSGDRGGLAALYRHDRAGRRRSIRRSRSEGGGPMRWLEPISRHLCPPGRWRSPTLRLISGRRIAITPNSKRSSAKEPISAPSPVISPSNSEPSATSPRFAVCRSDRSPRHRRFPSNPWPI